MTACSPHEAYLRRDTIQVSQELKPVVNSIKTLALCDCSGAIMAALTRQYLCNILPLQRPDVDVAQQSDKAEFSRPQHRLQEHERARCVVVLSVSYGYTFS